VTRAEDVEIRVRLRARALAARTPPDAQTGTEGNVALTRERTRTAADEIEPGERYENVEVEKRLSGQLSSRKEGKS
jgi:hypothetical protein